MEINKKRLMWDIFFGFLASVLLTLGTAVYIGMIEVYDGDISTENISDLVRKAVHNPSYILMFGTVFLILIIAACKRKFVSDKLYKYRFLIGGLLFIICVLLEINGSSIGMWNSIFGEDVTGILAGVSRNIRTDEWAVSTPMAMSQYYDAAGPFSYFSHVVRGTATDVFLEYGQPVRDIAVLFRPFHWGYLFLPLGKALAFYWCGRLICLFLVSFEFGMLLTKNNGKLALAYAVLFAFAPVVQWWFATNSLVEMLIAIQLSILMLVKYMQTESYRIRLLCIGIIVICAGGYLFAMYPAWMVPLAYILLGLAIWAFSEYAKGCRMRKADWLMVLGGILVLAALSGYIFLKSGDTIASIANTVYPGKRFSTGGGTEERIFNYASAVWYAMGGEDVGINVCENVQFIDFFPMCYLLPVLVIWKEKNRDKLLCVMLPVSLFLGVWSIVGFPKPVAGVTLMSYTTGYRTLQILGVANLILLFRSVALMKEGVKRYICVPIAVLFSAAVVMVCRSMNEELFEEPRFTITVLVFITVFYLILRISKEREKKIFAVICCLLALMSGLLVNPVRRGADNVYDLDIVRKIQNVHEKDPEALWVSEGMEFPYTDVSIMTGAPTLNSTNVYPAIETWRKVDDDGKYEKVYNRYAHITVEIKEKGQAEFKLAPEWPDHFTARMTIEDLKKIGVKYMLTRTEFDMQQEENYNLKLLDSWKEYRIYKVG